ncbi:MAG TPA: metallophosphoesterase [Actinoplanes sp.]|nr:metallophosphoesterase [Actinoplanes sp.]
MNGQTPDDDNTAAPGPASNAPGTAADAPGTAARGRGRRARAALADRARARLQPLSTRLRPLLGWLQHPRVARLRAARPHEHHWVRRGAIAAAVIAVSVGGVVVGTLLGAHANTDVGPFRAEMSISPSISGGTEVDIPPLGSLHLDSHNGPIHLKVNLHSLDQSRTEALIGNPNGITAASRTAVDDVTQGVLRLGLRALGVAVGSALLLAGLVFRNVRRTAWSGLVALLVSGASLGLAAATVRADSISEPRYEGLLVNAPAVVGDARRIADNYGRYAEQLQQLVGNVGRIYTAVSTLPVYEPAADTTRVLHVSDLHLNPSAWGVIKTVVTQFEIDVVVDTGDIVDWGSAAETSYVSTIKSLGVPYVYIRGNHDSAAISLAIARQKNATVLENSTATVAGLTFAGIGDPRFTPDKSTQDDPPAEAPAPGTTTVAADPPEVRAGVTLATTVRESPSPVDIALVHDPATAAPLAGTTPLVLAGHTHRRTVNLLAPVTDGVETRLMVQGSTGGAGLRGLEGEEPTPLAMSVLYFDENRVLKAYDDISVGGTGTSQVTLERKVIGIDPALQPSPSVAPSGPVRRSNPSRPVPTR